MENTKRSFVWAVVVVAVTLGVFLPVVWGGFLSWDDHGLFVENTRYRGLSMAHWNWMCTTFFYGHWQPLSWFSYALDYTAWGMNPTGWHAVNLLLHAVNAALVYLLCLAFLNKREGRVSAAVLAALFWAVHPLRVEAVAWLATRGYLLCTTFCLLTVLFYLQAKGGAGIPVCFLRKRAHRNVCPTMYLVSLLCFALATFTKGIGMMLPAALLLIDWVPLRRITSLRTAWRCGVEKVPFFALSLVTGMTAYWAKNMAGGMVPVEQYGPVERFGQALYGIWFYLLKTIEPLNLVPLYYKRPEAWQVLTALLLTAAAVVFLFLFRRKLLSMIGTFGAFLLLVFPMLGITQSGAQLFADRFTYLAAVPFSILLAFGLMRLPAMRRTACAAAVLLLLSFGAQTVVYAVAWSDDLALWNRAVRADRSNARAFNLAGQALLNRQHVEEAVEYFDRAIELSPGLYPALQNRARAWAALGEYARAVADLDRGLAIESLRGTDRIKMRLTRAQIMEKLGKLDQAVCDYSSVINHPQAHAVWRAMALQSRAGLRILLGHSVDAQADLAEVLKIQDYDPQQRAICEQVLAELKKIPVPKCQGGDALNNFN